MCCADLHNAGAQIDFSVLYPSGNLVDAPLPTWTHRELMLVRDPHELAPGGATIAVHPLLGAHARLPEEPERHAWQADVGTETQPWLGDHQVHNVAALPGAAYCEMALAAARTVLGDTGEVHDISFDQLLLLGGQHRGLRGRDGHRGRCRQLRGGDLPAGRTGQAGHRRAARRYGRRTPPPPWTSTP